jgi:hypothetical protein
LFYRIFFTQAGAHFARECSSIRIGTATIGYLRNALRIVGLLIGMLMMTVSGAHACSNAIVARADAPDGRHTAILFQRDCGATTGFSTHISIMAAGEQPTGSGNAFRADTDHGAAQAGAWGGPWAAVEWTSSTHLVIRYAGKSRVFAHKDDIMGVTIDYEPVEQSDRRQSQ